MESLLLFSKGLILCGGAGRYKENGTLVTGPLYSEVHTFAEGQLIFRTSMKLTVSDRKSVLIEIL